MINTGFLYSKNDERIFINTSLGCKAKCKYCYLSKFGYDNKEFRKADDLIKQIEDEKLVKKDTLVTLGCFSECFDDINKSETIKIIKYFLEKGNQVQVATKKKINLDEINGLQKLIRYKGQLVIFVSSATISEWDNLEVGTDLPKDRFENFEISLKLDIPTVLYMKPIIKNVTINDIDLYKEVIKKYNIKDVVVGSIFTEEKSEETVHFTDDEKLFYNPVSDEQEIKQNLNNFENIRVWSRSSEVMKFYRVDK